MFPANKKNKGHNAVMAAPGASAWPLDFSVFMAAELEVPDTLGARYFFSFWSVLIALWLNGLFILTECHPAWL